MRPSLPTAIQLGFLVFWMFNATFSFVEDFILLFMICVVIGGLQGTEYTNFLYLANAKIVSLPCDMGLDYYERELTVNMLLMASDLGKLVSTALIVILKLQYYPELVFHSPA